MVKVIFSLSKSIFVKSRPMQHNDGANRVLYPRRRRTMLYCSTFCPLLQCGVVHTIRVAVQAKTQWRYKGNLKICSFDERVTGVGVLEKTLKDGQGLFTSWSWFYWRVRPTILVSALTTCYNCNLVYTQFGKEKELSCTQPIFQHLFNVGTD